MNFVLKPSLEYIALSKVAILLWNQKDIRIHFTQRNPVTASGIPILGNHRRNEWHKIEEKVIENASQLLLPELLKRKIVDIIYAIGLQILDWVEYHNENPYFGIDIPHVFCWTPRGTIDLQKTAEMCVKNQELDIIRHYNLACNYCLEHDVAKLWDKMPERHKKSFYNKDPRKVLNSELVIICTYDMKGEIARLDSWIESKLKHRCPLYLYAFEYSARSGNTVAVNYFWQKLNLQERENILIRIADIVAKPSRPKHTNFSKKYYTEILCFLLSQMDEENQTEVFKSNPFRILLCFLEWPFQSFFMEIANRTWDFLSADYCYCILRLIINKTMDGYKDFNYQKLFGEFWEKVPITHKKHCLFMYASDSTFLLDLLKIEDKENFRLILKYATIKEKEKILLRSMDICKYLLCSNDWDFLKFFVQECVADKHVKLKFKGKVMKHIGLPIFKEELDIKKDIWNNFLLLLKTFTYQDSKNK